jgi:acetyltransferase-like isoleucine patch superfamily enzyme
VERYYSDDELRHLGLGDVGQNVRLDRSTVLLNPAGLRIGDNTRIDAFCLISAFGSGVSVGRNVHIAAGAYIFGSGGVTIEDFAGLSARSIIYSANDDYSGEYLTGPTIEPELRAVRTAPVRVGRHAVVGAGSIILPGVTLGDGSAIGALSLIKEDVDAFTIVAGSPARAVKTRSRRLLVREAELLRREQERGF